LLLVLADGMGGHLHGDLAASLIVRVFADSFAQYAQSRIAKPKEFISDTMHLANNHIMKFPHNRALGSFPGSTCVVALIQDGGIYWGHAGDSRLYVLRNGMALDRTLDHSMVQQWVEWGVITDEEARIHPQRNQIINCLGGANGTFYVEPGGPVALQSGDVLLLCSDGLWEPFTDQEIAEVFTSEPVADVLDNLIARAMERGNGHSDNATGVAVRWDDGNTTHDTDEPVCRVLEIS